MRTEDIPTTGSEGTQGLLLKEDPVRIREVTLGRSRVRYSYV